MSRSGVVAAALIGTFVLAGVLGLRAVGWLQPLELAVYDQYLRHAARAPDTSPPSRVLMLEITEQDIRDQGHWPLSDHTLAAALRELLAADVSAIGLDIYRDLPVPPGEAQLEAILREEPRIVTVRKWGDAASGGIPGPPVVEGSEEARLLSLLVSAVGGFTQRIGCSLAELFETVVHPVGSRRAASAGSPVA